MKFQLEFWRYGIRSDGAMGAMTEITAVVPGFYAYEKAEVI